MSDGEKGVALTALKTRDTQEIVVTPDVSNAAVLALQLQAYGLKFAQTY